MTFLHPLGLLGLIGIPILIIIYIIKTQYTEQTITSTFIWTLSEKFLKRKNPISKIAGIISLILQLLAVTAISLAIAHPIITLPDSAQEYLIVLDGSLSMQMGNGDNTRFDRAKDEINDLIDDTVGGSVYTLVYAAEDTLTVFERLDNKKQAKALVNELAPGYIADDFSDALSIAEGYFAENPALKTYLFTDKSFESSENVTVVNVAGSESNISISEIGYTLKDGKLTVNGSLIAYGKDDAVNIHLYLDGSDRAIYSGSFYATAEKSSFSLYATAAGFKSIRVVLEANDGLSEDNEMIIYNTESEESYSTLIVSDRPFFIEKAFESLTEASVTVISPENYTDQRGYGLYVFDSFTPSELPRDGGVWFINPTGSVKDSGFSYQNEITLESGGKLDISNASSSTAKKLREDIIGNDISISAYVKCGLYKEFTTLYSYQANPVVFAGTNNYGNRQVVFAMDLHKSDIAITYDYSVIMRNLIAYSFPAIIDRSEYTVNETLEIGVVANCESIRLDTPSGEVKYLDISSAVSECRLTEIGTYTLTVTVAGTPREFKIYSAASEEERVPNVYGLDVSLNGEAGEGGFDGRFDTLTLLFVLLAVLFLADWGVYCYEKHQLR